MIQTNTHPKSNAKLKFIFTQVYILLVITEFKIKIKHPLLMILNNGVKVNKNPDFILFNSNRLKMKIIVINTKKLIFKINGLLIVTSTSINVITDKIKTENKKLFIVQYLLVYKIYS